MYLQIRGKNLSSMDSNETDFSTENLIKIEPQEGPQKAFLETEADIAVFGGAAGGGKSFGLLLDPIRHHDNGFFRGVIFRRETPQITNPGGLWDEAMGIYTLLEGKPNHSNLHFKFPSGMQIKFAHLEQESDVHNWQGAQVPWIGFDELTHFTEKQFFYMLSRNRSASGVKSKIRGTCNPDPDSFVRKLIDWWIAPEGFPYPERSGVLRYFIRRNDQIIWSDTKETADAKSFTFIPARLEDNKILMEKDPAYRSNLEAMSYVDRMRLLYGNWNIRPAAGLYFRREMFEIVDAVPADLQYVRYWDRASSESPDADWSAGFKMGRGKTGLFYVTDLRHLKGSPLKVQDAVMNTANQDGRTVTVGIEQDPGQAGVMEAQHIARLLAGFNVKLNRVMTDKVTRASPFSAQCEAGNVKVLRGLWNEAFFNELESFPDGKHDDIVDAGSGAFNLLTQGLVGSFSDGMAQSSDTVKASRGRDQW
jgi:predicted phage terminase large subunit-like protein